VLRAAQARGDGRTLRVRVTPAPPAFSTSDARRLRIHQRLATVTLPVASASPAGTRRAVRRLDGTLVRPNADFSLVRRIGSADDAAHAVVASAVYDAAFRAGMGRIARSAPRTSVVGSAPGLDATVRPDVDLAWVNETPYGVYVRAITTKVRGRPAVKVSLWGHRYWTVHVTTSGRYNVVSPHTVRESGPGCRARRGVSGFDVDVSRRITRTGERARVERTHSHYEPLDAIVCR
jgi:vancomycin resistance protein YoaR